MTYYTQWILGTPWEYGGPVACFSVLNINTCTKSTPSLTHSWINRVPTKFSVPFSQHGRTSWSRKSFCSLSCPLLLFPVLSYFLLQGFFPQHQAQHFYSTLALTEEVERKNFSLNLPLRFCHISSAKSSSLNFFPLALVSTRSPPPLTAQYHFCKSILKLELACLRFKQEHDNLN